MLDIIYLTGPRTTGRIVDGSSAGIPRKARKYRSLTISPPARPFSVCAPRSGSRFHRCGIGTLIEKSFEGGREALASLGVPVHALAVIRRMDETGIYLED